MPISIPPEVLFHRYFQENQGPHVRAHYWGKLDLSGTELTDFERLLVLLQSALNEALQKTGTVVAHHVICPPLHVDYVKADVQNALAFQHEGYSFIGLTEPLMYKLWDICVAVGELGAPAFRTAVRAPFDAENLRVVLFRVLLLFIVCHEYTHHAHGHVPNRQALSAFFDEIGQHGNGNLEVQAIESDADGYATFLVMDHLIAGGTRQIAIPLLNFQDKPALEQDQMLFSCFVLSVGGFFYATPPAVVNSSTIYTFEHPPQAARMNCVMNQARRWCDCNRPELRDWMNLDRFQTMMNIVAHATWDMNGGRDWAAQTAFFRSEEGAEYFRRLDAGLVAHIRRMELRAESDANS